MRKYEFHKYSGYVQVQIFTLAYWRELFYT